MAKLEKGFLFLYDWLPAIEELPAKDVKKLLLALIDFQRNGTPIPVFTSKKAETYARMIEPSIRRRLDGQKGGTSRGTTQVPPNPPTQVPMQAPYPSTLTPKQSKAKAEQSKSRAESNAPAQEKPTKSAYGEFSNVFLTEKERKLLEEKYGSSASEGLIDNFSRKIKAKGYQYEDHYATILDWANKDGVKPKEEKSYDVEEFFNAALARSYESLQGD